MVPVLIRAKSKYTCRKRENLRIGHAPQPSTDTHRHEDLVAVPKDQQRHALTTLCHCITYLLDARDRLAIDGHQHVGGLHARQPDPDGACPLDQLDAVGNIEVADALFPLKLTLPGAPTSKRSPADSAC